MGSFYSREKTLSAEVLSHSLPSFDRIAQSVKTTVFSQFLAKTLDLRIIFTRASQIRHLAASDSPQRLAHGLQCSFDARWLVAIELMSLVGTLGAHDASRQFQARLW